jgi:sigma-B regulation protein RsbQ
MAAPAQPIQTEGPRARRHRVRISGEGARVVVLSHGLGTDQSAWDRLRPWFESRARVVSYDLPGAGPLLPPDFDPARYAHLSAYADDLLALLDELDLGACTFVGHSVSGMVGALAAIEEPGAFERLVMINASPRYLDDAGYRGGFTPDDLEALFNQMHRNYEAWVAGFAPAAAGHESAEATAAFTDAFLAMRPDVTAAIARAIFTSDLRALLPSVTVPVALVHSRQDLAVPPEVADYLLAHLPDARRWWIDTPGHLPHVSDPDAMAAVLGEAL